MVSTPLANDAHVYLFTCTSTCTSSFFVLSLSLLPDLNIKQMRSSTFERALLLLGLYAAHVKGGDRSAEGSCEANGSCIEKQLQFCIVGVRCLAPRPSIFCSSVSSFTIQFRQPNKYTDVSQARYFYIHAHAVLTWLRLLQCAGGSWRAATWAVDA